MNTSEVSSECGVLIQYVSYLLMTLFFFLGYIFFSFFKVESNKNLPEIPLLYDLNISRKSQEDKIKSFFTDFDEEPK